MFKNFPYVEVPEEVRWVAGEYDEDTRSYHAHGDESQVGYWYEALNTCYRGLIPVSGISMYVPVSRTAIHKRIKAGDLTTFHFHSRPASKGVFANKKEARETPYVYVPISECKNWAREIRAKMIRLEHFTLKDLNEETPDWHVPFYHWLDGEGSHFLDQEAEHQQRAMNEFYEED